MLQPMTEQEIEGFQDYLADILKVWDCYEQDWVVSAPLILRFENADVVVEHEKNVPSKVTMANSGEEELISELVNGDLGVDRCLCWLHADGYGDYIGELISLHALLGD